DDFLMLVRGPRQGLPPPAKGATPGDLEAMLIDVLQHVGAKVKREENGAAPALAADGASVFYALRAGLPLGAARDRLESLSSVWHARQMRDATEHLRFEIDLPQSFWQKCRSQKPRMAIHIGMRRVQPRSATPIEITCRMNPVDCNKEQGLRHLKEISPP